MSNHEWKWPSTDPVITNGKAVFLKIDKMTAYLAGLIIFLFFAINTWALYQSFTQIGAVVNRLNANTIELQHQQEDISLLKAENNKQKENIIQFYRDYGGILDDLKNGKR